MIENGERWRWAFLLIVVAPVLIVSAFVWSISVSAAIALIGMAYLLIGIYLAIPALLNAEGAFDGVSKKYILILMFLWLPALASDRFTQWIAGRI